MALICTSVYSSLLFCSHAGTENVNADVMSQLAQSTLPGDPAMTSGDDGDSTARAPSVVALPEPGDVGMELVAPDVSLAPVNTAMMSWDEEILLEWWQVRAQL